jgi:hypothetical protein
MPGNRFIRRPPPPRSVCPNGHDETPKRSTDHLARLGPRLPMAHLLDSVDWTDPRRPNFYVAAPTGRLSIQTRPGPMMGSQAEDHDRSCKTQHAETVCDEAVLSPGKVLGATRPIDPAARPGFAARIRDRQHHALQTGQASVGHGHGRALFFSHFSSPAETSPEDEGKDGAVVGPLTDWTLTLPHSTVPELHPIQVQHCDVAGGENLEVAIEPSCCNEQFHDQKKLSTSLIFHKRKFIQARRKLDQDNHFAKSTTSSPFPDRPLLSPILILLRSWLHWINI